MRFLKDTRGNVAITSAIMGTVLLTATGAAIDGGRFISTKQKLQSIADAAALAAMTPENASETKRLQIAQTAVDSYTNGPNQKLDFSDPDLAFALDGNHATLSLSTDVPMLFSAFLPQKDGRVSVVSHVEESFSADTNALSISVVLDLSESMSDGFDNVSKLAAVQAAVKETLSSIEAQFGGKAAAATRVSTGVYPFNWGLVNGEATPLAPGTDAVLDSLTYLSLAEGSLSTTAMEAAVADQIAQSQIERGRDRFIFYITDGKVDEDKSDISGRYLRNIEMYESPKVKQCIDMGAELIRTDLQQSPAEASDLTAASPLRSAASGLNSGNNNGNNDDDDDGNNGNTPNGNAFGWDKNGKRNADGTLRGDKHAGHVHTSAKSKTKANRVDDGVEYLETCRPIQPVRIAEACEMAREAGVSIIGVNMSGEDGPATPIMDVCVNGLMALDTTPTNKRVAQMSMTAVDDAPQQTRTTPSGMSLNVSADGKSFAGDVSNMTELREMLASVLPNGDRTRKVRLVN